MVNYLTSRSDAPDPDARLLAVFDAARAGHVDAVFLDGGMELVAGVAGLPRKAPVMRELCADPTFAAFLDKYAATGRSVLFTVGAGGQVEALAEKHGEIASIGVEGPVRALIAKVAAASATWAGTLEADGSHLVDLKAPAPGPHFSVNLLLGNRIGFANPLQTTPKSVVDRVGRGSFRSHAATQVLATRWDLRQEENGFPANRQIYLSEGGRQLLYTGSPEAANIVAATCRHARNHSVIEHRTDCGLVLTRTIFLLPQEAGMPLAVEAQRVELRNEGKAARRIKLTATGMFGPTKPAALMEDVLYSCIIMQGGVLADGSGGVLAASPHYHPAYDLQDLRFHAMILRDGSGARLPREFGLDYTEFVGSGTLERPAGLPRLSNRLPRKGPGFFALAGELEVGPGETVVADCFTGLVSSRSDHGFDGDSLRREVELLHAKYAPPAAVPAALERVKAFQREYSSFLKVEGGDPAFATYVGENLPFQVLYQSFVSRSLCQTQKGYREIGFREIQDLYSSLYYFNAMGRPDLVRSLILEWAAQVHEFGYANHNFFWVGKEPGKWSDDQLWLHQAVGRYLRLTGDASILDATAPIAGSGPVAGSGATPAEQATRPLYETLKAALRYSTEVSLGAHGIPLLDLADWNDCLKIDREFPSGAEKEKIWKREGKLATKGSESVMNGFLAVVACRELEGFARAKGDAATEAWAAGRRAAMEGNLRKHCWKGRSYARLLLNDYPGFEYAGADGDGLDTDGSGGSFYINSFSWAVHSGVADEAQIASMLEVVRRKLKTPFGLKLVSPSDLSRVEPKAASAEYYPGDRENGAVFKHAAMMAVAAMFEAAKRVKDASLARELAKEAWEMVDLACPVRSMTDPFVLAGNPRFCTQYNNSETGENIGPLLSGTAPWLMLSLLKGFGIEFTPTGVAIDPILREADRDLKLRIKTGALSLEVLYVKPSGFRRKADGGFSLLVDGRPFSGTEVPLEGKKGTMKIEVKFA